MGALWPCKEKTMNEDFNEAVKRFVDLAVDAIVEEALADDQLKPFTKALDDSFKEKLKKLLYEAVRKQN
jgi:hypothetical protein